MRISLLLFLMICSSTVRADDTLRIAFWNVENLFDSHRNLATPNEDLFVPSTLNTKLRKDGEIIRELNADIVGLMEVENHHILKRLVKERLADMGYQYTALIDGEDERGIDCALISRHPFTCTTIEVPGFYRSLLLARFVINGEPLYVIVNHWKSRFNDGSEQRMSCANSVLKAVNELIPAMEHGRLVPIVIGGDLNDNDWNESVVHLEQQGLVNTLKSLPEEQRWTLPYDNRDAGKVEFDSFDHVFINSTLKDGSAIRWASSQVIRPARMVTSRAINGESYMWPDDDHDDHIGYSDHFPVVTELKITK
ncbi:MAG: hypothetical protein KDA66_08375 [Planctomycetaceae bacterium]|nr:hypothetical protein [Planctomycetaceae bacterium]MCB9953069.1 hypothetical protein [Planctomycetaceae bacterium]